MLVMAMKVGAAAVAVALVNATVVVKAVVQADAIQVVLAVRADALADVIRVAVAVVVHVPATVKVVRAVQAVLIVPANVRELAMGVLPAPVPAILIVLVARAVPDAQHPATVPVMGLARATAHQHARQRVLVPARLAA